MSYAGAQLTTDTICLPTPVFRKIMAAADSTKLLLYQVNLQKEDLSVRDERIANLITRDSVRVGIVNSKDQQISIMGEQRKLYDAEISNVTKLLKKEKRKRWWTAVGGIVAASGAFWLGLKL